MKNIKDHWWDGQTDRQYETEYPIILQLRSNGGGSDRGGGGAYNNNITLWLVSKPGSKLHRIINTTLK